MYDSSKHLSVERVVIEFLHHSVYLLLGIVSSRVFGLCGHFLLLSPLSIHGVVH